MSLIFTAILALGCAGLFYAGPALGWQFYTEQLAAVPLWTILGLVGGYLLIEGYIRRGQGEAAKLRQQQLSEKAASLEGELNEVRTQIEGLSSEYREVKERERIAERRVRELEAALAVRPAAQGSAETLVLISLLQERGRLIDFLEREITSFSDEEVGRVARFVHQGSKAVFKEYVQIEPLAAVAEGEMLTLERGYDVTRFAVSGATGGGLPYTGKVVHRGWQVTSVTIPKVVAQDAESATQVITPAIVEISSVSTSV